MLPEISPLELQIQTMTSELERLPQDKSIWSLTPTGKGGQLALDLKLKVNEDQYLDASRVYEMNEIPTANESIKRIVDAFLLNISLLDYQKDFLKSAEVE